MTDIKAIADGLSEAHKDQVVWVGKGKIMEDAMRHGLVNAVLINSRLLWFRRKWWLFGDYVFYLTSLGLAVRAHIMQEQSNG